MQAPSVLLSVSKRMFPVVPDQDPQSNIIFLGHDMGLPMAVERVGCLGNSGRHLLIFLLIEIILSQAVS